MGRVGRAQPLDGGDRAPDIAHRDLTGAGGHPVDMHGAGAALGDAAAVFRAGNAQNIPQRPQERHVGFETFQRMCGAVDDELHGVPLLQPFGE